MESSVEDGLRNLILLYQDSRSSGSEQRSVLDNLIDRLNSLKKEKKYRGQLMAEIGGPETLLHGDLWTTNVFVVPDDNSARLIDWDHVGVGQIAYDLSTYLLRFPIDKRQEVLDLYQRAIAPMGYEFPSRNDFNVLCLDL